MGGRTELRWQHGLLVRVVDPTGVTLDLDHDAAGELVAVTNAVGDTARIERDRRRPRRRLGQSDRRPHRVPPRRGRAGHRPPGPRRCDLDGRVHRRRARQRRHRPDRRADRPRLGRRRRTRRHDRCTRSDDAPDVRRPGQPAAGHPAERRVLDLRARRLVAPPVRRRPDRRRLAAGVRGQRRPARGDRSHRRPARVLRRPGDRHRHPRGCVRDDDRPFGRVRAPCRGHLRRDRIRARHVRRLWSAGRAGRRRGRAHPPGAGPGWSDRRDRRTERSADDLRVRRLRPSVGCRRRSREPHDGHLRRRVARHRADPAHGRRRAHRVRRRRARGRAHHAGRGHLPLALGHGREARLRPRHPSRSASVPLRRRRSARRGRERPGRGHDLHVRRRRAPGRRDRPARRGHPVHVRPVRPVDRDHRPARPEHDRAVRRRRPPDRADRPGRPRAPVGVRRGGA